MDGLIPVVLCIDVEPDKRAVDPDARDDWKGFEKLIETLESFRTLAAAASGRPAVFNWFLRMDPQIESSCGSITWVADHYREQLARLESAGDGIGLHVHPWRSDDGPGRWTADFADAVWIRECVERGFAGFQAAMGRPCRVFRFGDGWLSEDVVAQLEEFGVNCDLTIEPGVRHSAMREAHKGREIDYTKAPRRPYRPAIGGFLESGGDLGRNLWMIPVTTGDPAHPQVSSPSIPIGHHYASICDGRIRSGILSADPNPIPVAGVESLGSTKLSWTAKGVERVQVRCGAPDGSDFATGGPIGSSATGAWVRDRMTFFLQDITHGLPLSPEHTLATVTVRTKPIAGETGTNGPIMTADLSYNSLAVCAILDQAISSGCFPLCPVMRTATGINEQSFNLHEILRYIASHPQKRRLAFVTPTDAIRLSRTAET